MKTVKDNIKSVKRHKNKKKVPSIKHQKEKVLVVAQEFKFARLLSGNEKKTRDRVLKTLKKWLLNSFEKNYEFKKDDFIRVWKGLFYAVWMSDKPLVQEDLCENIAGILDLFSPKQFKDALLMVEAGFQVLAVEWYGIDHHRMDKFHMLVRRYLRGAFRCLLRCEWSTDSCKKFTEMLTSKEGILSLKTPVYARNALALILHITDCYLEELSKVSRGSVPEESVALLLEPYCALLCGSEAPALCEASHRLLAQLLRQSELGLEYEDKTRAWHQMGCPSGGPDALELVPDEDEEEESSYVEDEAKAALDPRAGRVSVLLAPLPAPATRLAALLRGLLSTAPAPLQRRARCCLRWFEELSRDVYPLRIPVEEEEEALPVEAPRQAAARLRRLERKLVSEADELALRGLRRKHRKRLLAKSRAGVSLIDDLKVNTADTTTGDWKIEESEPDKQTNKRDSNKENESKQTRKRKLQDIPNKSIKRTKNAEQITPDKNEIENINKSKKKTKLNKKDKVLNENKSNVKEKKEISEVEKLTKDNKADTAKLMKDITHMNKLKKGSKSKSDKISAKKNIIKSDEKIAKEAKVLVNKVKNFQKNVKISPNKILETPKKVKFVLKNNSMQGTVDYYKSVRQSPNIPFDSSKQPVKTNLKPSTPSPINPFFKKKLKMKK